MYFVKGMGRDLPADFISKRFKKACRDAGIEEGIHFHCLRHGAITKMIMNGAPLPVCSKDCMGMLKLRL